MSIKHYDVVRAASPSDLAEKLTHKLKEGLNITMLSGRRRRQTLRKS
ncbi:DUF1737 domain-containing protein [Escherichia coli]|nr:DUF1737 domain-containing protein [Escherichia coli]MCZ5115039.1 DUF1737 domain-containing protein [Escherichia coli]MCZ5432217.1 DUF1737 domain-containing protein [Escherichia coli]